MNENIEPVRNAKVFCLASAKGGSGKTIIAANIASFLTDIGRKCLIIDCDAATHGMTLLYYNLDNRALWAGVEKALRKVLPRCIS